MNTKKKYEVRSPEGKLIAVCRTKKEAEVVVSLYRLHKHDTFEIKEI